MPKAKSITIAPDSVYHSVSVAKFINNIMRKGKKTKARKIVYNCFEIIKEKTKKEPLDVFEAAIKNVKPMVELKPQRVGGATFQVPKEIAEKRGYTLAMRWLIQAARSKKGKSMEEKLAEELISAFNNQGTAVKKKENVHKMAEANRAFSYLSR